ncbi:hypothetical protein Bca52824_093551 [Brassica carinata]|uniref:Uncharacterized protein n=1 Tax=Brassica carinata TaxID=52824 RepID=A0A8X7P2A0_BRACI|nr:hypothetical protein Bca52824_093551 [Brassica carinata]
MFVYISQNEICSLSDGTVVETIDYVTLSLTEHTLLFSIVTFKQSAALCRISNNIKKEEGTKATGALLPSISFFGGPFLSPPPGMDSSLHTLAVDVSFGGFHGRCGRIWSSYGFNLHIAYGFHG